MRWSHLSLIAPSLFASSRATATWKLTQPGTSGVAGMQMTVVSDSAVMFVDKNEANPLRDNKGQHALGAVYWLDDNKVQPINGIVTNSLCAGGGWLSNGTMVNIGGNQIFTSDGTTKPDGRQGIRLFNQCKKNEDCYIFEDTQRVRLTSSRWYTSGARLTDGSLIILGGSYDGDWTNNANLNNPTYEFFPPKNINGYNGLQIPMDFLKNTLPHNLFPHALLLPDGTLFIAANNNAMIFNWKTNTETRLPDLPNGQRCAYPMSGIAVLLPLKAENGYAPEVLICGGSHVLDTIPPDELSSSTPASDQCSRMLLTPEGIKTGWQVEHMPQPRVMPDAVIQPDGKILIINGASSGTAGYGNVKNQIGQSNAANPVLTPVMYDPDAPAGQRFSSEGLPTSDIPRMYHSVATMTPDGTTMVAGSNPNLDVTTQTYPTEYRVEMFHPPYVGSLLRPILAPFKGVLDYRRTSRVLIKLPAGLVKRDSIPQITFFIMDMGFSTHGVHMDQRMVILGSTSVASGSVSLGSLVAAVTGPPNEGVYPPGPCWLGVKIDGVPSIMQKIMVGGGHDPPVDQGAIDNMLAKTGGPSP